MNYMGVHMLQGERAFWGLFGICVPIGLNGQNDVLFAEKCRLFDACVKS